MNNLPQKLDQNYLDNHEKIDLLKNTICKGCSDNEFELFLHACKRTGLDPFMRQIYAVKRQDTMTIQTGIDGYRLIAERTGRYAPGREPTFQYTDKGQIISATAYVKKQTEDGTWHEVACSAFFNEYCQKTRDGKPTRFWMQMGHVMISKCAEALALRKAFPGDLSGIYTKEEMEQAEVEHIIQTQQETAVKPNSNFVSVSEVCQNISKNEWESFQELLKSCTPEHQEKVWSYLHSQKIHSQNEIDKITLEKLIKGAHKNISKSKE